MNVDSKLWQKDLESPQEDRMNTNDLEKMYQGQAMDFGNKVTALEKELTASKEDNKRNFDKWWGMEQTHILPLFKIAKEKFRFDLQKLVYKNAGKNSTILFAEHVEKEISASKEENKNLRAGIKDLVSHHFSQEVFEVDDFLSELDELLADTSQKGE